MGELQLKALIGADGLVKQVTVLSGDPKLAEVGMRAVRQWHYAPYQVLGNPVEVETQIKMNFFGEDAVSVASVATRPAYRSAGCVGPFGARPATLLQGKRLIRLTNSVTSKRLAALLTAIFCIPLLHADERKIDPTFLYRDTSAVKETRSDLTTAACHYKPLFGQGDPDTSVVVGVARYGEALIDPHGACATVQYPGEDQVYVVLDGKGTVNYGNEIVPLGKEDYLYLPATVPHTLKNSSASPLVVVVMGFRTQGFEKDPATLPPLESQHRRRAHGPGERSPIFDSLPVAHGGC